MSKKKQNMSNSIINTSAIIREGDIKIFLSATDDLGTALLKKLTSGEYEITEVSGNQQIVDKLPAGSLVIQKRSKTESNEQS